MRIDELIGILNQAAPFSLQEDYDNSGLQIGDPRREIKRALVCLDVTREVIREAIDKQCDLIISHHPLIFKGIKQITGDHPTGKIIIDAVKNDIGIVAVHTNLDNASHGVNHILAEKLGLSEVKVLRASGGLLKKLVTFCPDNHAAAVRDALFEAGAGRIGNYDCCSFNIEGKGSFRAGETTRPFVGEKGVVHSEAETRIETIFPAYLRNEVVAALQGSHPYEEVAYDIYSLDNSFDQVGSGVYGYIKEPLPEEAFLGMLKTSLGIPVVRHSGFLGRPIRKVALCGGSGSFLLERALSVEADAFVTSDVKYHQFFDACGRILMVDAGHYETEQFSKELLVEIINKKMIKFALLISEVNTNPIHYY